MEIFSSIKSSLSQNSDFSYSASSGEEYTIFGTASPSIKTLILDGEIVPIAALTFTWSKRVMAPQTGAITKTVHSIQYFAIGSTPHQLGSGSNYIEVIIHPSYN
jgi:hypothetical protein